MQDSSILMHIASRLTNTELETLFQAGLWPIIRSFAQMEQFWYMRVQTLVSVDLQWQQREWRQVYQNLILPEWKSKSKTFVHTDKTHDAFGHLDTVEVLLEDGLIPSGTVGSYVFCSKGDVRILDKLHAAGVWARGTPAELDTLPREFTQPERLPLFNWLSEKYPNEIRPRLDQVALNASWYNFPELLAAALEFGPVTDKTLQYFSIACSCGYLEVVKLLMTIDTSNKTQWKSRCDEALASACHSGKLAVVKFLIENGHADPTDGKCISLANACRGGDMETVLYLLSRPGVNPGINSSQAFVYACGAGRLEVAQLLSKDKRVKLASKHNEALRDAVHWGQDSVVSWLLTLEGVDPFDKPVRGKVDSFEKAVRKKHTSTLDLLLRDEHTDIMRLSDRLPRWLPLLRPLMADKLKGCVIASALSGELLSEDAILDWVFTSGSPTPLISLFQFVLIKRPTPDQLASHLGESEDEQVALAIQSVMQNNVSAHTGEMFSACRALVLVLTGWHHVNALKQLASEKGVTETGMKYAARLLGAHLGGEAFSFRAW